MLASVDHVLIRAGTRRLPVLLDRLAVTAGGLPVRCRCHLGRRRFAINSICSPPWPMPPCPRRPGWRRYSGSAARMLEWVGSIDER
jgi:hypothetical protein